MAACECTHRSVYPHSNKKIKRSFIDLIWQKLLRETQMGENHNPENKWAVERFLIMKSRRPAAPRWEGINPFYIGSVSKWT